MSNEINEFGSNAQKLNAETAALAKRLKNFGKATFRDLSSITGSVSKSITTAGDDVSKWNISIERSFSSLTNYFGSSKNGTIRNVSVGVEGLLSIADSLVGGVFRQVDTVMKLQDSVTGVGISATKTTTDLVNMAKSAGYPIDKASKLMESFNSVGESLKYLGPNTGKAAERLAKVFDNREDQLKYLKQGLNPEMLMKYQAEGVKYLTGYGVKIGEDDRALRKSTLAYVDTLTTLSMLTGESRDQAATRLAGLKSNTSYQIKMRELIKSGNNKAADNFGVVLSLLDNVSPELNKGMADWIANGTATTEEGKKMMLVMGDRAAQIAKAVEDGTMTGAEAAREVGVAYQNYAKKNKDVLSVSKDLQNASGINGRVFQETEKLAGIKTEEDAKKLIDENAKKPDDIIDAKNTMIDAEREMGFVKDTVVQKMMPFALTGFNLLVETVKKTAFAIADFGRIIGGGKYTEGFEKMMLLIGNPKQLEGMKADAAKQLADMDARIERVKAPDTKLKDATAKRTQAERNLATLTKKGAPEAQKEIALKKVQDAKEAETLAKEERDKNIESGISVQQLLAERAKLQEKKDKIDKGYTAATTATTAGERALSDHEKDQNKQNLNDRILKTDLGEAAKYIEFGSGSGSEQNWAQFSSRNPGLAKNVTLLAQEYFKQTNKKLSLTSSFRSYEEQKSLYQGWLKAGGGPGKPMVYVPGHGNVNTPANPDVRETPHMSSTAVDISKDQLDWMESRGILQRAGLRRPYRNDPVHIEKAKFGKSMIQGKEIEMHGREALIELFNGTIPINLPPEFKENTFSEIRNTIKPKANMQTMTKSKTDNNDELDLDLLSVIDSQFDDLIASMDKSNDLQHSIKTYMAA